LVSGIWTNSPGGSNNPAVLPADQSAEFFRLEMREVDSAVILCQLNAHHQIHLRRADRGGLDAAIYCKVPHGGWCPKGRLSEDGTIPDKYDLREMTNKDYLKRTEANVVDSDATVIFTYGLPTGGSLRTIDFARKHGKPYERFDLLRTRRETVVETLAGWLNGDGENDYEDYQATPPETGVRQGGVKKGDSKVLCTPARL
jgi:hypothetical protein